MFGSFFRDIEEDPIFGAHTRMMNNMMGSFFGPGLTDMQSPLSIMGPGQSHQVANRASRGNRSNNMMGMDPLGMMSFGMNPFAGLGNMDAMLNDDRNGAASFSTMSVSYSSNGNGQPHVYQASSSTRRGPGGIKETRKTMADSRSGTKKMSYGRHIGERGHVLEREMNLRTGQREESEDFHNISEGDVDHFNREWQNRQRRPGRSQHSMAAITNGGGHTGPQIVEEYHSGPYDYDTPSGSVTIEELPPSDEEMEANGPPLEAKKVASSTGTSRKSASGASRDKKSYKEKKSRKRRSEK